MTDYKAILKQYWGYDTFRDLQENIIESVGSGKDTLGLMPTGGGKSITFQVPALAKEGLCLVVTPLIALMKDQVQNLRQRDIKAAAIYSGMSKEEIIVALENCIFGDYKFLYVSPERLETEIFRTKLRKMNINLIAVDESHCISQWGYDFRPSYLKIAEIRDQLPGVPVLALTATATKTVVKDIQKKLHFARENVFRMSFERKNLAYVVRSTEDKQKEMLNILKKVPGCSIVYVRNRRRTKEICELLRAGGVTAEFYHAGISNQQKDARQRNWQNGDSRVMVATNAFGMGIDKPDVRTVIHLDLPDSPEAYFQEAGRAGRDGLKSYAVLLYQPTDKTQLLRRIPDTYPDKDYIKKVYEDMNFYFQMAMGDGFGCTFDFNLTDFCYKFKHFPVQADSALKILTHAGYIEYTDEQDNGSRFLFKVRRDELYRLDGMGREADELILAILRSYTGIFTDYAYIDEELMAQRTQLTREQVYNLLKMMNQRQIADYIPRKKTQFIVYSRSRVELRHLIIPREVYEDRKEHYEERIRAMIGYVTSDNKCRSRMLLRYFGDKVEQFCGICDWCVSNGKTGQAANGKAKPYPTQDAFSAQIAREANPSEVERLRLKILEVMAEGGSYTPDELADELKENNYTLSECVRYMIEKGELTLRDGLIRIV